MANAKNTAAVADLKKKFENSDSAVVTEYRGLSVPETTELRKLLGADVTYSVAKNTMVKLAANDAGVEIADDLLTGPTAIAFINGEIIDVAKAMRTFSTDHDNFVIKGGNISGEPMTADQVMAFASLDNRETALAKLAGGMKATQAKFARVVEAYKEKKEAE